MIRRGRPLTGLLAAALLLVGISAGSASAAISAAPARTWGTNGRVLSIVPVGNRVYIAGTFSSVIDASSRTYPANNIAVFIPATGRFDTSWPVSTDNTVSAMSYAGGGLYLGGAFGMVNGVARSKLAKVDAVTGVVDTTWTPKVNRPPDQLTATASQVYVSGQFTTAAGSGASLVARPYVARFNGTSGALDTTWLPTPNDRVFAIQVSADQQSVYLGGIFTAVNGTSSPGKLARVSASSGGLVAGFVPGYTNQMTRGPIYDIAVSGTTLYLAVAGAGGACTAMNGLTGATLWSKHSNGNLQSVRLVGSTVYCGGHFTGTGGFDNQTRYKLAAVDAASGTTLPFAPVINSALGVWSLGADPTHLYVGGDFTKIGTTDQPQFAMFLDSSALTAPGQPESPSCGAGDGRVTIQWLFPSTDGGQPVQRYSVYRSTDQSTWTRMATTSDPTYADGAVTNGTAYSYRVSATNTIGEGAPSATVSCTPQVAAATVPAAPGGFTAAGVAYAASLAWTTPADGGSPITAYQVYRGDSAGTETLLAMVSGSANAYTDAAVTVGNRYYYRVSAVNAIGEGPLGVEDSAVPTNGTPSTPVVTGTVATGSITLAWTAPKDGGSPITKYVLTRDNIRIGTFAATQLSYVDSAVTPGTTYTYRLKAVNAQGNSPLSAPLTLTAQ